MREKDFGNKHMHRLDIETLFGSARKLLPPSLKKDRKIKQLMYQYGINTYLPIAELDQIIIMAGFDSFERAERSFYLVFKTMEDKDYFLYEHEYLLLRERQGRANALPAPKVHG